MRIITIIVILLAIACGKADPIEDDFTPAGSSTDSPSNSTSIGCGTHNGKQLYKGPSGGCYYLSNSGKKTYVNRNKCNC